MYSPPHRGCHYRKLLVMYVVCDFVVVNDLKCLYSVIHNVAVMRALLILFFLFFFLFFFLLGKQRHL